MARLLLGGVARLLGEAGVSETRRSCCMAEREWCDPEAEQAPCGQEVRARGARARAGGGESQERLQRLFAVQRAFRPGCPFEN